MFVTRHVEIPEPLMLAQEQGRLVVFVGAGASFAPPSSLPLFSGLAEAIAADTQSPYTSADLDEPSKFIGQLADQGRPVYQRAHARVSASTVPNDIHKALVELFPSLETLRIVTTNWDRHLTAAAEAKFRRRPHVYTSPALPLGRDFSGIVHLHGSLNQEPEDLIMTEADFGRAYLTDAYCARFVYEMFRSYTVLFVGYSHKDPIMYHLGRGLPPKAEPRYGIINDEVPDDWRALRIIPIVYPSDGDHAALAEGLKAWAWLIQSGHLDYERRVQSLLASATMPPAAGLEELNRPSFGHLHHRGAPAPTLGVPARRLQILARLVLEAEVSPAGHGRPFLCGHVSRRQAAIASSSRSAARRVGTCQLAPIRVSISCKAPEER